MLDLEPQHLRGQEVCDCVFNWLLFFAPKLFLTELLTEACRVPCTDNRSPAGVTLTSAAAESFIAKSFLSEDSRLSKKAVGLHTEVYFSAAI